jgi:hypothetical protein
MAYVSYPEAIKLILLYIGGHRVTTTPAGDVGGADVGVKASLQQLVVGAVTSLATANVPLCDSAGNPILDAAGNQVTGNFATNVLGPISDQASNIASGISTSISDAFTGIIGQNPLSQDATDWSYYASQTSVACTNIDAEAIAANSGGVDVTKVTSLIDSIKTSVSGSYQTVLNNAKSFTDTLCNSAIPGTDGFSLNDAKAALDNSVIPAINEACSKVLPKFDIKDFCGILTNGMIPDASEAQQELAKVLNNPKSTISEIELAKADLDKKVTLVQETIDSHQANYTLHTNINDLVSQNFNAAAQINDLKSSSLTLPDAAGNPIPIATVFNSTLQNAGNINNLANALVIKDKITSTTG